MEIVIQQSDIEKRIFTIRNVQVVLDNDLADFYQVSTSRLNEQVKRNTHRFPADFMFQLTEAETTILMSQNAMSSWGGRRKLQYVFTEQGVAAVSAVLKSDKAAEVSINIMRAFVNMRRFISQNALLFQKLDKLEIKQLETDQKFEQIFKALESKNPEPEKGIFFDGQIFDAYVFVASLVKKAKSSIMLVDNYVDETVLTIFAKRNPNVKATIFTQNISPQLKLDLHKHNAQYPAIELKTLADSHDRFLVIDHRELYHIGASLKDLGKKWFAFSRMDSLVNELLSKLNPNQNK
jgi:hypothetical protein